eukprot:c13880_g1_i1 orf=571-2199(+)
MGKLLGKVGVIMQPKDGLHHSKCLSAIVLAFYGAVAVAVGIHLSVPLLAATSATASVSSFTPSNRWHSSKSVETDGVSVPGHRAYHLIQNADRRHLLESKKLSNPVRLRLLHRNSPNSPFRKEYSSMLEALEDARAMDMARVEGLQRRIQKSLPSTKLSTSSISGKDFRSSVQPGAAAGAGQYFVDFFIGTPPQKFVLIADTGSDLVWVRCAQCARCGSGLLFHSKNSSTYSPIPCLSQECLLVPSPAQFSCNFRVPSTCRYDYVYADLSESSGIFSLETVTLNSSTGYNVRIPNIAFGCGLQNMGQSFVGSAGVMGLGRGSISFASQLGSVVGNKFSYCFADFFHTPAEDSFLTFGDAPASSSLQHAVQYTPLLKNPFSQSFYYVGIREVAVDGRVLPIPSYLWEIDATGNGGTVIDSGTTLTFFVEPAYRSILRAMRSALTYPQVRPLQNFDLCFNASGISDLRLPELSITFRGEAYFSPSPANYFIDVINGVRCLGLQGVQSPFGFSILGNLLQQNFNVEYDRENGLLGFSPATCSSAS